jgi:hypothetical protein
LNSGFLLKSKEGKVKQRALRVRVEAGRIPFQRQTLPELIKILLYRRSSGLILETNHSRTVGAVVTVDELIR